MSAPTGIGFIAPPKTLDVLMHYFISGDPTAPPSLITDISNCGGNEYIIRGQLNALEFFSANVFNPGSGVEQNYYDAYNVVTGDWVANDGTGFTWKLIKI